MTTRVAPELLADGAVLLPAIPDGLFTANAAGRGKFAAGFVNPALMAQPFTTFAVQATTSGTVIDFTGIPSWARQITLLLSGVSTSGTNPLLVQLGTAGSFETSGYAGGGWDGAANYATPASGFSDNTGAATTIRHQAYTISLLDPATNLWVCQMLGGFATAGSRSFAGSKALAGPLTRVRLTTVGGTDTFDAGSAGGFYEG